MKAKDAKKCGKFAIFCNKYLCWEYIFFVGLDIVTNVLNTMCNVLLIRRKKVDFVGIGDCPTFLQFLRSREGSRLFFAGNGWS